MASVDIPPDRGGGQDVGQHVHDGVQSYAKSVGSNNSNKRAKLNVLDIVLERKERTIDYNLTKEELAKLLFHKMKLQPQQVTKIDTAPFGKIHIELSSAVNPELFSSLPAFDIRDGLRTKLYKPHHRKEVLVNISWLDLETPDELILHILSYFGKVKSGIQYKKIKEEPGESAEAKLLNNIFNGERQVWMEIETQIPSYGFIDGRRVKISYIGQQRTCARCCAKRDICPGQSNARVCEENGGLKANTDVVADPSAVEADAENTEQNYDDTKVDGITLDNLKENCTEEDVKTILSKVCNEEQLKMLSIHPMGSTKSKLVKCDDPKLIMSIGQKIDKKIHEGKMIYSRPHVPVTPPKTTPADFHPAGTSDPKTTDSAITPPKPDEIKSNIDTNDKPTSTIPGLPQSVIEKATKTEKEKIEKQKKKVRQKAAKLKKRMTRDETETNLQREDFLSTKKSGSEPSNLDDQFQFSDYGEDDSDSDAFEDSKDALSESEENGLFTPVSLKSHFAKTIAKSCSKTFPRPRSKSLAMKRQTSSPREDDHKKLKLKVKSLLPVRS